MTAFRRHVFTGMCGGHHQNVDIALIIDAKRLRMNKWPCSPVSRGHASLGQIFLASTQKEITSQTDLYFSHFVFKDMRF